MNESDSISDEFTYTLGGNVNESANLTINIKGTNDAPTIESIDVNNQPFKVIDGLLDINQDGIVDTLDPSQLVASDGDEYFSSDNGNISIDLGSGGTDMAVEYLGGQAGYTNVIGFYEYDEFGNPTNPIIIYVEDEGFRGEANEFLGTLEDLEGKVGFFIVPNGASVIDTNTTLTFDGTTLQANGSDLSNVYYTDNNLSTDGKDHAIIAQDVDGTGLVIAFEDLSLGDQDYDDVVIKIKPCLNTQTEIVTENLVVNGSFEDVSGIDRNGNVLDDKELSNGEWIGMTTLAGWELMSDESRWMEVHDGSHAGVGTTDGDNYFDMGESATVSGDKDAGYTANTHIGQVINGVISGNTYELSFDYRDKAAMQESGISGENSGVVEVYWGGELITTIQGNNTDAWETLNVEVIGGAGDGSNRLEFKEIGEGYDNWGIALDNISLVGTHTVNTDMNIINDINISDVDDDNLESATVTLSNYKSGDVIDASNLPSGITATITELNGELVVTLSGTATVADYETAIESLTFESSSEDRTPRDFEIVVNDGSKDSNAMTFSLNIGGCTLNPDIDDSINAQVSIVDGSDANDVVDASTGLVEGATVTGRIDYGDTITKLVITDGVNEYVIDPTTITVQPDGTFTLTNVDVSSLNDGTLTVKLDVEDNAGNTASDSDTVNKDTVAEITITSTNVDSNTDIATVSGKVNDVEDGQEVTVVFKDEAGVEKTVTVQVQNGSWEVSTDVSNLITGKVSVSVSVEDQAGNKASDDVNDIGTVNLAPEIGTSEVRVSEEGLDNSNPDDTGSNDTTNDKVVNGNISISDADGDSVNVTLLAPATVLTSNGVEIVWSGNDSKELIGQANGNDIIKVVINDNGDYKVELMGPVDHADTTKEDELRLDIGVKADDGIATTTGTINVTIEDDMPTSCGITREIDVQKDLIVVKNLEAGFTNSVYLNGTDETNSINNDSDAYADTIEWGTPYTSANDQSAYNLVDNSEYTTSSGSQIDSNGVFKLADFTHENWTIKSGSSTLDKTTVTMTMDVVINGQSTPVSFNVLLDHTETVNSDNSITSRDIIELPQNDVIVNVAGQDYTFTVEGFQNSNGEYVKTIYTDEQNSNDFGIFASIKPVGDLPTINGNVCTDAGADGLAAVQWGNTDSPYGTMSVDANGAYTFVVNQETKDSLSSGESLTQEFTYTVVDKDGDSSTNTVTIKINGTQVQNLAPEAENKHVELECGAQDVVNISFVVDVSSSMNSVDIQLVEDSIAKLISKYEALATEVNVNIVQTWGGSDIQYQGVTQTGWSNSSVTVNLLEQKGWTDYDQGLKSVVDSYPAPSVGKDVVFVFADGMTSNGYQEEFNQYLPTWQNFVDSENVEVRPIAINTTNSDVLNYLDNLSNGISTVSADQLNDFDPILVEIENGFNTPISGPQPAEFTLKDFVSDVEDDMNSTVVKIKIVSLPEDGVLTVNGNAVQVGDIYDETAQIIYTPNNNIENTLYGTTSDTGSIADWGSISNGVLTTTDGKATIKAFAAGQEIGFASENNNYSHDGLGIGVDSSAGDDDQIDKSNDERVVIEFESPVSNAEFGLASLGDYFKPDTHNAKAQWIAKDENGNIVETGFVQQSIGDSNPYTNSFTVNGEFSSIEFFTTSDTTSNANFSIQYMNVNYSVDDSFDYKAIDSNGAESDIATVTFDINTMGCVIKNSAPDAIDDGVTNLNGIVLVSEEFTNGATGWTDNTVTTSTGELGSFLGRFGGTNCTEGVSKIFDFGIENAGKTVTIDFDMYEIDSWDGEEFIVYINGEEVSSDRMKFDDYYGNTDGGTETSNNEFTGWGSEDIHHYTLEAVVDSDGKIKLGFGTTLNQEISDESWGIDNLVITSGDNWSNTLTTDEDSAITVDVLANDTDPENDTLSITHIEGQDATSGQIIDIVKNGVLLGTAQVVNGKIVFTPGEELQKMNNGEDQEVVFEYTITDGNGGSDSANVTLNVTGLDDNIGKTINAAVCGTKDIAEGNSGWYNVQLDQTVTEDTWVTVQVYDGTAYRVDANGWEQQNQDIMWGGYFDTRYSDGRVANIYYDQVPNSATSISYGTRPQVGPDYATWDYTVEKDGLVQHGGVVSVLIKAGESESNYFEVQTWKEKITTDNDLHSSTAGNEYVETLNMAITNISGNNSDTVNYDNSYKNVNIHDGTCVFRVSPITLDLTGDGQIGVTGETSSIDKGINAEIGATVEFDIDGDGELDTIEWIDGLGDGLLVDNRDGNAADDMDGTRLFGEEGGKYSNGYEKLALLDVNNDGKLSGDELTGLNVWVDDGDAKVEDGELKTLEELEITSISTQMTETTGVDGKMHMESTATKADGTEIMTEDVWFTSTDVDLSKLIRSEDGANIVDIENEKADNLDIDLSDVVDLVDGDSQLIIRGDLEDTIDLDSSEWTNAGNQEVDGVTYNVFNGTGANSTIKLLIEDDIDTNI